MYSMDELKSWWEIPAIAHFFSLFKTCFSLTDFTIEELEECLLTDGEDDKSTIFTSRLLTELLQGCYENPNISVTTYHDSLIHIMKKKWEDEDGRVNPLSSMNADFHSLPTLLKVQIIHRLTEYRLDASDVESKIGWLAPSDLRLEPLGADQNGARYWYFFGVRLYKETPPPKKHKKRKREGKMKKKESKKPKLHSGTINKDFLKLVNGEKTESSSLYGDAADSSFVKKSRLKDKKKKKKSKKKHKHEKEDRISLSTASAFRAADFSKSNWEIVCYNVDDWKTLAMKLQGSDSLQEQALCQLITDNFLPNLPKIVEDMELQKLQKEQVEMLPRRSSCRLLAKKLYQEEDDQEMTFKRKEVLKREREEREQIQSKERDARMKVDFEKMLQVELARKRKETYVLWKKEREAQRMKRLSQGLPAESDTSSDESLCFSDSIVLSRLQPGPTDNRKNATPSKSEKIDQISTGEREEITKAEVVVKKKRGRPPSKNATETKEQSATAKSTLPKNRRKSKDTKKNKDANSGSSEDELEFELLHMEAGDHEYTAMKEAWETVDGHSEAWPFQKPVEEWYAPGYHDIIKRPMDLSTIEIKLDEREYKVVSEFRDDITLMFNNCRLYNGPESEYTEVANTLDKLFQKALFIALTRQEKSMTKCKGKPGRKKKSIDNEAEKDAVAETNTLQDRKKLARGTESDADASDDDETSDEFTPGVAKSSKAVKRRLSSVGKGRGRGRPAGRGRGRGRKRSEARSISDVKNIDKSDSDDSKSSASTNSVVKTNNKRKSTSSRGRGGKSKRGRRTLSLTNMKSSAKDNTSSSEASDGENEMKLSFALAPIHRRGAGRGRPRGSRGRGRGRRPSARTEKKEIPKPPRSDSEETEKCFGVTNSSKYSSSDEDVKSIDGNRSTELLVKTPKEDSKSGDISIKHKKSPNRVGETSSSSSRASSRSPSPEKVDKVVVDVKSKPIMWSLDYLASQARVLDEQYKKEEVTSKTSSKKTLGQTSSTSKISDEQLSKSKLSPSTSSMLDAKSKPGSEFYAQGNKTTAFRNQTFKDEKNVHKDPPHREQMTSLSSIGERDVYSFNDDEDSPRNIFPKITHESATKLSINSNIPRTVPQSPSKELTHTDARFPLPTPPPSGYTQRTSDCVSDNRGHSLKSRQLSSEQLASPSTPSSGYGSNKTVSSNLSHLSPSPYSASDNSVSALPPKSAEDLKVVIGDVSEERRSGSAEKHEPTEENHDKHFHRPVSSPNRKDLNDVAASHPSADLRISSQGTTAPSKQTNQPSARESVSSVNPKTPLSANPSTQQLLMAEQTKTQTHKSLSNSTSLTQQTSVQYPPDSAPPFSSHSSAPQNFANRRNSQPAVSSQPSVNSPGYQKISASVLASENRSSVADPIYSHQQRTENVPVTSRQHSQPGPPKSLPHQLPPKARPPSYGSQSQSGRENVISEAAQRRENPVTPVLEQQHHPALHTRDQRPPNRTADGYITAVKAPITAQQQAYNFSTTSELPSTRSMSTTASSTCGKPTYYQRRRNPSPPLNVLSQNPTMANFGLTPQALSQPQLDERRRQISDPNPSVQRKASLPSGQTAAYPRNEPTNNSGALSQQHRASISQQPSTQRQSSQHYHSSSSTSMPSTPSQQHNVPSAGAHHAVAKQRHVSGSSGNSSATAKSNPRPPPAASGNPPSQAATSRRHSSNASTFQQKSHPDYMTYHLPQTQAAAARESRSSSYTSHQQNGLLSAAAGTAAAVSSMHQDLSASATLRALQQHKNDRASMLHYAANEQYNRLAASAHHRATSQHGHPLAGVYHPHPQNAATTSPHQAAAQFSSPWLQAAANPAAGYPGNLLPPPHMDPVYHLMQQSGMHGQYPMYSNPVMQQIHQQHLQHHMLPKY